MKGGDQIWALGAMSGTSLDGVDAAMLCTDGEQIFEFGSTHYAAYSVEEREVLRGALGGWPGELRSKAAARVVEDAHIRVLGAFERPQLIGFHGQTLAHDPKNLGTHQAGDGSRLAQELDAPVVWDFRSADVALGGQGAPLAPFFHFALARWIGAAAPVAFLNLGGVGNLTWVDPRKDRPDAPEALLAFDTGPANAPMDDLLLAREGLGFDKNGARAEAGKVVADVMEQALRDPFFQRIPPKSLDRGAFPGLGDMVKGLGTNDALATLAAVAAGSVVQGLSHCPTPPARVLVSGGGRLNRTLMKMLSAGVDCPVEPVEATGLDGDMIEAQAFAYLAVRVVRGLPTSAPGTTGVAAPVAGGTLSQPNV